MIVSVVLGGLGNQLFQYATARYQAKRLGCDLYIEKRLYHLPKYKIHPFALDNFQIDIKCTSLMQYINLFGLNIFREKNMAFDPNINFTKNNTILVGYWHSEKYFEPIRNELVQEIKGNYIFDNKVSESLCQEMRREESVSIHVRRSDYLSKKNSSFFESISLNYYYNALELIKAQYPSIKIFVFSDDNQWVMDNFKTDVPTIFVTHNDVSHGYDDMILMSNCKHNITANSTFSWWGAWLNENPSKFVFTPAKWVKGQNYLEPDLIPESWIKL